MRRYILGFILIIIGILSLYSNYSKERDLPEETLSNSTNSSLFEDEKYNNINNELFFTYDDTTFDDKLWEISGKSIMIKSVKEDLVFLFIKEGQHKLRDKNFTIKYNIVQHYDSNGERKMYFNHIFLNDILVKGKMTNKESAVFILKDISNITKGAAFLNNSIGTRFILECAATLLFNKFNNNRNVTDYINMPQTVREKFIQTMDEKLEAYYSNISESLFKENSNSYDHSNVENFDIYLKVMEFKSVNGITYDNIKTQYKILAKKYHPDMINGDAERFKLIQDTYQYLQEHYPR